MRLYKIRGGNLENLQNKKYNIGVGISLGNKWFTIENITDLVKWSIQNTKDIVIVYVADYIHAINIEVRNRVSREEALRIADNLGKETLKNIENTLKKVLPIDDFKKIKFIRWLEIVDDSYKNKLKYLYSLYKNNRIFREKILSIVSSFICRKRMNFTEEEKVKLGTYIIEELPELITIINTRDVYYDASAYPFDNEITELAEQIQKGEFMSEIKKNIMDTGPKVFLEVR